MPIDIRIPLSVPHPVGVAIKSAIDALDKPEVPWFFDFHVTLVHSEEVPTADEQKKIKEISESVLQRYAALSLSIASKCNNPRIVGAEAEDPIDFGFRSEQARLHVEDGGLLTRLQNELRQELNKELPRLRFSAGALPPHISIANHRRTALGRLPLTDDEQAITRRVASAMKGKKYGLVSAAECMITLQDRTKETFSLPMVTTPAATAPLAEDDEHEEDQEDEDERLDEDEPDFDEDELEDKERIDEEAKQEKDKALKDKALLELKAKEESERKKKRELEIRGKRVELGAETPAASPPKAKADELKSATDEPNMEDLKRMMGEPKDDEPKIPGEEAEKASKASGKLEGGERISFSSSVSKNLSELCKSNNWTLKEGGKSNTKIISLNDKKGTSLTITPNEVTVSTKDNVVSDSYEPFVKALKSLNPPGNKICLHHAKQEELDKMVKLCKAEGLIIVKATTNFKNMRNHLNRDHPHLTNLDPKKPRCQTL